MKNTQAATILFDMARHHLGDILGIIDHYNAMADALVEMGYVIPDQGMPGNPWPVPRMELCGNGCMMILNASVLDEFEKLGPVQPKRHRRSRLAVVKSAKTA